MDEYASRIDLWQKEYFTLQLLNKTGLDGKRNMNEL